MITNNRPTIISRYSTWILAWPNVSSAVTLVSNWSDTDRSLSVARAAGSHHIGVAGGAKSWHGRTSTSVTRCFVPCLGTGGWRRRNRRSILRGSRRMKIDENMKLSSMRSLRAFALMWSYARVFHHALWLIDFVDWNCISRTIRYCIRIFGHV